MERWRTQEGEKEQTVTVAPRRADNTSSSALYSILQGSLRLRCALRRDDVARCGTFADKRGPIIADDSRLSLILHASNDDKVSAT